MNEQKIIINNVDVSECEFFEKCEIKIDDSECLAHSRHFYEGAFYDCCDEHPDCYYKQLKRKEQECEELKKQLIQKDEVNTFFNTLDWNSVPCEICPKKNCLDEIEGIVNFISNITNCDKAYYCKDKLDEILQKINEVKINGTNP